MENHPIPQDVTGFQFKLIGDMTVKQFAYLATGAILAWIFFVLPINIFIRLPLSFLFASAGAALAFLPVAGRPLDTMLVRFVADVFSSNQYMFEKQGGKLLVNQIRLSPLARASLAAPGPTEQQPADRLRNYLQTLPQGPKNALDQKEQTRFESIFSSLGNKAMEPFVPTISASQQLTPPAISIDSINVSGQEKKEVKDEEVKKRQIAEESITQSVPAPQLSTEEKPPPSPLPSFTSLQKQLSDLMAQKREIRDGSSTQTVDPSKQVMVKTPKQPASTKPLAKSSIPFAPDAPNIVAGIVKDSRENVLPNILVEVKDKEGNPLRAFKTNTLGQFASATPLSNGTYTMQFEDPSEAHGFNILEIQADGNMIPLLEIVSTDAREELRQTLFGR